MRRNALAAAGLLAALAMTLSAQDARNGTGDAAVAQEYARWALEALQSGRLAEAEEALERASDFADLSSDLSYLLALARLRSGRPMGAVLEAARRGRKADRWRIYSDADAAKLESRALIGIRAFDEALSVIARLPEDADTAYLRLQALRGAEDGRSFQRAFRAALDAYPADPRFARFLLESLAGRLPGEGEQALVDAVLRRLPSLIPLEQRLGYLAAPFVRDADERRRMVGAYRALGNPDIASLAPALELGLMDEKTAVDELFAASRGGITDIAVFRALWKLLRNDAARSAFGAAFSDFSGVLTEDGDGDGRPESSVRYERGQVLSFAYDADQDGIWEGELDFQDGLPVAGTLAAEGERSSASAPFARPVSREERGSLRIFWERYPAVRRAELGSHVFHAVPGAFHAAPVQMAGLFGSFLYPRWDERQARISERSLVSFSFAVERPGSLMDGSVERIELLRGIPQRALAVYGGRPIAVTEYERGMPARQRLDLDADGRMETRRRFRVEASLPADYDPLRVEGRLEYSESDWDGDGLYEYTERYAADGSVERSWEK